MRLIFYLPKFLFQTSILSPLGSYTQMETLFPILVAALEVLPMLEIFEEALSVQY